MLLSYSFGNFRSFRDPVDFTMLARNGKVLRRFPDNYVSSQNGQKILKCAVLVGENAGGKSNFIYSLQFLKSLFQDNSAVKTVPSNVNNSIAISNPVESFSIEILASNQIIYHYELQIDSSRILSEKLSFLPDNAAGFKLLFHVNWNPSENDYLFSLPGIDRQLQTALKNNAAALGLFVTRLALLGDTHAIAFVKWMTTTLFPLSISEEGNFQKNTQADLGILKDPRYLDIFRMVDYSIVALRVDEEHPFSKTVLLRKRTDGTMMERELQYDSAGVREFFVWAAQIYRVIYEDKVVFADEMDRVLNPVLSERVISYINGNAHMGQFIFSTHNVLHLNLKTYMKEQIYFVTKKRDALDSELYSLGDFPEVRYETSKIYEFYMKGILGGTASE